MGIGKRIKEARELAGLTQEELGKIIGVTGSAITNYEKETSHPKEPVMYALIDALGVDANFLFQDCVKIEKSSPCTGEAMQLAKDFDALDKWGKRHVRSTADIELARMQDEYGTEDQDESNIIYIDHNDQKASAGTGFLLDSEHLEQWAVQYNDWTRKADFCVDVRGDSMEPLFSDGDVILIRSQPSVNVGEIGLFMIDGQGYVKKQGEDRLISLNPDYDDVFPTEFSDVRCSGLVLGVLDPDWIVEE